MRNTTVFTMKVVVGKAYGHQTPVFASEIKSVIFRPYWNVPSSILGAELIPHLEKNSSYFSENSYEIVDKNERVVSEGTLNEEVEAQLRAGKLSVRQTPGPQNALGLIKFEFPSEYDVYMHGTPAKQLFSRTRRDFSHGCIRVEDPVTGKVGASRHARVDRRQYPICYEWRKDDGSQTKGTHSCADSI